MKKHESIYAASPLFAGIQSGELESLLHCLNARVSSYPKDSVLFLAGDPARHVGMVLDGAAQVVRDDVFGNRAILTQLERGDLFGETFACAGTEILPVSVLSVTGCDVLLMDYRKIITVCPTSCAFHGRLIENMMRILALKNLMLNQKMETLTARTTRDKLMIYLTAQATRAGSGKFQVPFNRQQLADYLSVDRSALSREMSAMRAEGLIQYSKNEFELLRRDTR